MIRDEKAALWEAQRDVSRRMLKFFDELVPNSRGSGVPLNASQV